MNGEPVPRIPPLEGCLYCHREGTTVLSTERRFLGPRRYPLLRCNHCGSVAELDYDPHSADDWRIRYRRVNHDPRYYYVAVHYRRRGWVSASDALDISRRGYAQRMRVFQAESGDLSWLVPLDAELPLALRAGEQLMLEMRAVTLREVSPTLLFVRPNRGTVLDSGKCYLSTHRLLLHGQRQPWAHDLLTIERALYNDRYWLIIAHDAERWVQYVGSYLEDQLDPQLFVTVVDYLALNRR